MKWNAKNKGKLIKLKIGILIKTIKSLAQEKREKCKLPTFGRKKDMNSQPKNKE